MNDFDKKKHITSKLNEMPDIKDQRTKQEVWQKIASHQEKRERRSSKRGLRLIPIFSTVLVIGILTIMVPQFIDNKNMNTGNDNQSNDDSEFRDIDNDVVIRSDDDDEDDSDNNITNHTLQDSYEQKVISQVDDDEQIVYAVVPDLQVQYMIPISFTIPDSDELDNYYNKLDDYIKPDTWGTGDFTLPDSITFDIDKSDKQITMHVPPDINIGSSANEAESFQKTLTYMFQPLGIDDVQFETEDGSGVDSGPVGMMQELEIDPMPSVSYKLYQETPDKKSFLTPVPSMVGDDMSIQDAMDALKEDQEDFHIQKTIPNDIDFDVNDEEDTQLIITFSDDTSLTKNQKNMTMIESILMTAKSFDYSTVSFERAGIEEIGPYDLSQPIDVPIAVNPIQISDEE